MSDRFRTFIDRILSHEGGFTDNRSDPGNWTGGRVGVGKLLGTKFGIAANTYPTLNIRALTRDQAIEIYRRDFWVRSGADKLPPAMGFQMLDAAVNHGMGIATRMLQRAAGVADDGVIGPATRAAIAATSAEDLALLFVAARLEFYTGLKAWDNFGKGWTRRMVGNLRYAAQDN
jgi:lysozyme family protein